MKALAKLTTTQATLYTIPTGSTEALSVNLVNTDVTNAVTVTLLASNDGGTTWYELFQAELQPNSTVQLTGLVLDGGDQIAGTASLDNVVSVVITGVAR